MRRAIAVVVFVAALGALSGAASAPPPSLSVPQKLAQRVKFDGFQDTKTTLTEALDKLSKLYDVTFDINEKAFAFEQIMDVGRTEIVAVNPIPAMKSVRLSTILRKILSRIPAPSGATFLVRSDQIEIATGTFLAVEVWGNYKGPKLPLVNAALEKCSLEEAVKELAEQADFNVVLDNRAADKVKTPVTAKLLNTPLDTALRLLADMADLRSIHLDNVLYVTTKENAAALQARLDKELGVGTDEGMDLYQRKGKGREVQAGQENAP
jgi:hypothetical protein